MHVEDEARHDAELPRPAAAARPVEVRVLCLTREERLSAGSHDGEPADVVARESVLAAGEPMTASERQAGDADGRARAGVPDLGTTRIECRRDQRTVRQTSCAVSQKTIAPGRMPSYRGL